MKTVEVASVSDRLALLDKVIDLAEGYDPMRACCNEDSYDVGWEDGAGHLLRELRETLGMSNSRRY